MSTCPNNLITKKTQKGQTLLEVVVALVVTVVVVATLAIITTNAIRDAQFARNQAQANELIATTLEQVRIVRNQQGWDVFEGYTSDNLTCYSIQTTASWELVDPVSCPEGTSPEDLSDGFFRRLTLCDEISCAPPPPSTNQYPDIGGPGVTDDARFVSVTISWNDLTGAHSITSETVLAKWQ